MNKPQTTNLIDKNGAEIFVGDTVISLRTYADYCNLVKRKIIEKNGEFFVDDLPLKDFETGVNRYTNLEIVFNSA